MENLTIYNAEFENDVTSMNNNSITATAQDENVSGLDFTADSDDFDKLLDDFIRKSLENDMDENDGGGCDEDGGGWDDDGDDDEDDECFGDGDDEDEDSDGDDSGTENADCEKKCVEFELGGFVYEMPVKRSPCTATKLVVHSCYEEKVLAGEPVVFVANGSESYTPTFVAHGVPECNACHSPKVYIYRALESRPVERVPMRYDRDDKNLIASCGDALEALPCGNYFFYLSGVEVDGLSALYKNCDGCCCIPFVKVDGDVELLPVALETASVKMGSRDCTLDVLLKFDRMLDKGYAYSLFLYNRNYNLVSRGATFAWDSYSTRKRKNLLAHLTTTYIPFGQYRLFIMQNDVPRWKVEFTVHTGKAVVTGVTDINPFGEEFLMLSELEKEIAWQRFREGSATMEMKEFFLSTCQRSFLNKKRDSLGLNALAMPQHFVYYGGNSVAELQGLGSMSRMFWNVSYFTPVDCITLADNGSLPTANDRIKELFSECNKNCIAFYNLSALAGNASFAVKSMIDEMNRRSSLCICLIGSRAEIRQFFASFPQLKRYFPDNRCLSAGNIIAETFVDRVIKELQKVGLQLSFDAQRLLIDTLLCAGSNGSLHGVKITDIDEFVKNGIVDKFIARAISSVNKDNVGNKAFLSTVEACDIDAEGILRNRENGFEESIRLLDTMVGLKNVKQNIITTFNRLRISAERRRLGLKVKSGECHHMLFTGNPGTGKTTVAKMMGRIYRSLGLLSKGDVVFVDRSKIVGCYIGDTEKNMQRILQEARGNILFIDEAYTLCDGSGDRKDFGHRAIECLLTVMAQEDCDMIVIFAGYSKEIETMMRCNQGLNGRFPYKFEFADYSADELMQIAEQKLSQEDYELTPEARDLLYRSIEETVANKDWDFYNARWVGQYVDNGIIPAQCERLMRCSAPKNRDDYRMINAEDIAAAYALHKLAKKNCRIYRGIGFTA